VSRIDEIFHATIDAHAATLEQSRSSIHHAAAAITDVLKAGGKILAFGNGGSAADAQHFAAEFINRFQVDRRALAAIALTTDTSVLTSIANDSSYDRVFARQIEAIGRRGDVALGITTSGRSPNIVAAFEVARSLGVTTIALIGADLASLINVTDLSIGVPSRSTPRVQEVHRTILHVLCELVEAAL
jgi:D-sedoheptulose 7-phosphate isomerase